MSAPTTFRALRAAADDAGRRAMYLKGAELNAPSYSETAQSGLPEWTCPVCGDRIKRDDSKGTAFKPCQCLINAYRDGRTELYRRVRPQVLEAELVTAGIPSLYLDATFDTFEPRRGTEAALEACQQYAKSFDPDSQIGLLLMGPTGSGKTHLAVALIRAILENHDIAPVFVEGIHLLHAAFSKRSGEEDPVQRCIETPLLVVDDLGGHRSNDATVDHVFRLIAGRYAAGLPTVITSNLDLDDIGKAYNDRLVSRLKQMCRMAECNAEDYRASSNQN